MFTFIDTLCYRVEERLRASFRCNKIYSWVRYRCRINTGQFPKWVPKEQASSGIKGHETPLKIIAWILTVLSHPSWVSESFRWDIGQIFTLKIFLIKNILIYLCKIWPIFTKRWKPSVDPFLWLDCGYCSLALSIIILMITPSTTPRYFHFFTSILTEL